MCLSHILFIHILLRIPNTTVVTDIQIITTIITIATGMHHQKEI